MNDTIIPIAKSIDEITQTGFYRLPDGIAKVSMQDGGIKHYIYGGRGLEGIIFEDGRHYVRKYKRRSWGAWEIKK